MSINSPTARWWRRRVGAPILLVVALLGGLVIVNIAGAVRNTGYFELEGDADRDTTDDWENVCYTFLGANAAAAVTCGSNVPVANTNTATSWASDGALNGTIFSGGGSKDPELLSSWAWKDESGGLPDKDNLLHAFAARYSLDATGPTGTCPSNTAKCEVLFFGSDRYDNSGDAVQGFWFLQNQVGLGSNKVGGALGFTGSHRDGDLLVISDFSNGGTTATIRILKWDSTCASAGGTCEAQNLRILAEAEDAQCAATLPANAPFCGIVNPDNGTAVPWSYTDKSGNNTYLQGEFFEAGVNLSALGLGDRCFSSLVSETRSSTSATATLKDFVVSSFGNCGATLTTTPKDGSGGTIPTGGLSIGSGSVQAKDSAALVVTGVQNWSGTMSFFLCGPTATTSTDLCTTGGTQIGSAAAVTQATTQPILSSAATITSAGRYCWRGFFDSSTEGLPDATDARANECFTVAPVTPTLSTQTVTSAAGTTNMAASVPFGTALFDKATLSGTATQPGTNGPNTSYPTINATNGAAAGGTITFSLYGPGSANCNNLAAGFATAYPSGITATVSGDGSYTTPTGFTPTAPGDYYWKASYNGSSPNTNAATHNGDCTVNAEKVTVLQLNPSIGTTQNFVPNDSATITVGSGAGDLAGTVVFKMWVNNSACSGAPTYQTATPINITTGTGSALSRTVVSNNSTSYGTTGTTFHWVVEYTSTNAAHTNVTSACGVEHSSITVQNAGTANA